MVTKYSWYCTVQKILKCRISSDSKVSLLYTFPVCSENNPYFESTYFIIFFGFTKVCPRPVKAMHEDTSVKLTSEAYREGPAILTSRARMYICMSRDR